MAIKKYTNGSWVPASYRKYGTETDTIATLPATVIGDGTPISSYTIKGNMEQNGTPTPSSPIYPSECGERTENLLPSPLAATISNNGITVRSDGTGRYYVSGTATNDAYIVFNIPSFLIPTSVGTGGSGTLSIFNTKQYATNTVKLEFYYQETLIDSWPLSVLNRTVTTYSVMSNKTIDAIGIFVKKDYTVNVQLSPEITNNGVLPANYAPYGYKLPLTLGSTTTNIYLGEVQSTRRIKKLVLDGTEAWYASSNTGVYYTTKSVSLKPIYLLGICDRFVYHFVNSVANLAHGEYLIDMMNKYTWFRNNDIANLQYWKAWLAQQYAAGTPVTIWYILAEPETGIVNEPIRKIGDYVDSVSGTNLATSGTAQQFDVGTTLKPSEVDMTYHGWHEHGDTKYST